MLQVSYIRDNREQVLERLAVKNFKQPELVDEVIQLDNDRKQTQSRLDNVSAEANANDSHSCQQRYCESFLFHCCNVSGGFSRPEKPPGPSP